MRKLKIANTEHGPVQGISKLSALGREYISFQGIPFMKAPVGKLRFRDAIAPNAWSDPYDTTEDAPCYCSSNLMTRIIEGQENAGTINVFTKCLEPENLFPVMIWVKKVMR
jgi:cholinesterase